METSSISTNTTSQAQTNVQSETAGVIASASKEPKLFTQTSETAGTIASDNQGSTDFLA